MYLFINSFTFKCILPTKVFYSTLNRTSVSILVVPNSPEMWWRKRDCKVSISIYDIMMTTTTERLFNAWIYYYARIRCKNKVNARGWIVCKMGWFVSNLTITRSRCNGIKFISNIGTVSKEGHFEHFPLKSPVIIKIDELRLSMLFRRVSRESQKDWNCSRFWLGDLYKHVRKHCSFFTVILVTKHSFRLDT